METAEEITKRAKSNLAFALLCLPKQRRRDMVLLYAFCRVIDDIADNVGISEQQRHSKLDHWHEIIKTNKPKDPENKLQQGILEVIQRNQLNPLYLTELIEGCRSDIPNNQRFQSWEDLQTYTYRVASCVGLSSIKIFGCTHPNSERYAETLGHALQLTNILRDVGHDLRHGGRVYIPLEDMSRFDYSPEDLQKELWDERFVAMMQHHAERAELLFQEAKSLLPQADAKALRAAESMRKIYHSILQKMKQDDFQVFSKHYKLSKMKKLFLLFG